MLAGDGARRDGYDIDLVLEKHRVHILPYTIPILVKT